MAMECLSESSASRGVASTKSDHQMSLLANLQDVQDREAHKLVKILPKKVMAQFHFPKISSAVSNYSSPS